MTESSKGYIIAIDGPVASGKGTIAPLLAENIHGFYLYSGAMYRCLALFCIENNVDTRNELQVTKAARQIAVALTDGKVFLHNRDVTERIRKEDVASSSSNVAVFPKVRKLMIELQRKIGRDAVSNGKIVVVEGRDTAFGVFPESKMKIFLTATPQIRAKRRLEQIKKRGEENITFEQVLIDTQKRDEQDAARKVHPLVRDPQKIGYCVIDNSMMTEEETLAIILAELEKRND